MKKNQDSGAIILHGITRCLNRCTFCAGIVNEKESLEGRYAKFLKDSQYFIDAGFKNIEISGNDPIQFPKILEAIKHLKSNGVEYITLSTHGRHFKNPAFAKDLAQAGLSFCRIPLYGSTEEIHNQAVQYIGAEDGKALSVGNAFVETTAGIKNCVANGIRIYGHIVPMQFNQEDLAKTIDLYLELTDGKMDSLTVASACITEPEFEYTANWYLPIKDAGKTLNSIINHHIQKDYPHINFKIYDFPFCTIKAIVPNFENVAIVPNLGEHKVIENLRSNIDDSIPSYRLKSYMKECSSCIAYKICGGIYDNDQKMFGTEGLEPITADMLMNPDFLKPGG